MANLRCLLVADFTTGNLAGYLENDEFAPVLDSLAGDFGQVIPLLTQPDHACWRDQPDFAVVWTQPEKVIHSFQSLLEFQPVPEAQLLAEVDTFCAALLAAAPRVKGLFVPTWTLEIAQRGWGMADFRAGRGLARALAAMNLRLAANLDSTANVFVMDAQRWLQHAGANATPAKLWYQAKIPFGNEVFQATVQDIKAAIRGLRGEARKLIVLDLDQTLWGGIVGDDGWENLRLGGHDAVGEAFVDFQRALKSLTRRGIVLGIVSKNTESVALAAIREHPEMVLRAADFAGWRINWSDKAANLIELVNELNLGLQSVVFIDDNPVERARVREALPEVLVPEWPENPLLYKSALLALRCFDTPAVSAEDAARTQAYVSERQRAELKEQAGSFDDWLKSLGIKVHVEPLSKQNLTRAAQLLNKTNQLNLATRRLTEAELMQWASAPGRGVWAFRVADRYGDSGLTGLASLEVSEGRTQRSAGGPPASRETHEAPAVVVDFLLSCRVMGRKVEETMTHWLVQQAKAAGASELRADYLPTAKNKPCLEYFQRSGFVCDGANAFTWTTEKEYARPACVELVVA